MITKKFIITREVENCQREWRGRRIRLIPVYYKSKLVNFAGPKLTMCQKVMCNKYGIKVLMGDG